MNYIDMHCDTLVKAVEQKKETAKKLEHTMVDAERLHRCGTKAQFFAMFLQQKKEENWSDPGHDPDDCRSEKRKISLWYNGAEIEKQMQDMYAVYQNTMENCADIIAPACTYEDLQRNWQQKKVSAFLTVENGCVVDGKMERLEQLYQMGVRLITLTWNDDNCFGHPHAKDAGRMQLGLTPFGKEAVTYMTERGILVDVSHLSDGGFYDVAELVRGPFVASHSNCRELAPATRNLTDDMIRILAEHGGVCGLNFYPPFLNTDPVDKVSRIERMCEHVKHLVNVGGIECVGIGTDFDGIEGNLEIADCMEMEKLFDALQKKGFCEDDIERIAYKNVERVIREVM